MQEANKRRSVHSIYFQLLLLLIFLPNLFGGEDEKKDKPRKKRGASGQGGQEDAAGL